MDPKLLEDLFNQGKISADTFKAASNKVNPIAAAPATFQTPVEQPTSQPTPIPNLQASAAPMVAPQAPTTSVTPMPEQPVAPTMVPQTSQTIQVESGRKETTTTSGKIKGADAIAADKLYDSSIAGQKDANTKLADVATKKAADEFNIMQEKGRILADAAEKRDAFAEKAYNEQQARLNQIDADVNALKQQNYGGYWQDKSTGTKILGAISIALGAYGAAKTGGQNYALNIINKAMDDDFQQYQSNINKQIAAIQQSRLSMDSKDKLTNQKLAQLDAYKLAQVEQVQNKLDSLSSKFGSEEAQAKLAGLNASLDQKRAENKQEIADKYAQQFQKTVEKETRTMQVDQNGNVVGSDGLTDQGKPMTSEQLKAQGSLDVMNRSAEQIDLLAKDALGGGPEKSDVKDDAITSIIKDATAAVNKVNSFINPNYKPKKFSEDVGKSGIETISAYVTMRDELERLKKSNIPVGASVGGVTIGGAVPSALPEVAYDKAMYELNGKVETLRNMLSEKQKQYIDEMDNFVASKLRTESGAAIGDSEFSRERNRFFPQPGDSPETIERKRQIRNQEIKARRTQTGRFRQKAYGE